MKLFETDWEKVLMPTMSLLEIFIRAGMVYLVILVLMRICRKQSSGISISDLILVTLIGNAVQNAIISDTVSVTDGLLLGTFIILLNYLIDVLAYRFPAFGKFIHPPPVLLIKNGKLELKNMQRKFITQEELESQVREKGCEHISQVKEANLEGDGHVSVIKK